MQLDENQYRSLEGFATWSAELIARLQVARLCLNFSSTPANSFRMLEADCERLSHDYLSGVNEQMSFRLRYGTFS